MRSACTRAHHDGWFSQVNQASRPSLQATARRFTGMSTRGSKGGDALSEGLDMWGPRRASPAKKAKQQATPRPPPVNYPSKVFVHCAEAEKGPNGAELDLYGWAQRGMGARAPLPSCYTHMHMHISTTPPLHPPPPSLPLSLRPAPTPTPSASAQVVARSSSSSGLKSNILTEKRPRRSGCTASAWRHCAQLILKRKMPSTA